MQPPGVLLRVLEGHKQSVKSVAFSPNGTRIVSGSDNNTLRLWDAKSGQPIGAPLLCHESWILSVAFSPDGTRIVSGSNDKTLQLWDAKSGQPIGAPLQAHEDLVRSVAFSPGGTRIVSGSVDNTVRLYDAKSGEVLSVLELDSRILSVAWHDDKVVAGVSKGAVQVFRVIEPERLA
jgi:WD40 repeat protein